LKANKVNLFVSSVLCVFWYHSPNVLDTLHIFNISWLRVKLVKCGYEPPVTDVSKPNNQIYQKCSAATLCGENAEIRNVKPGDIYLLPR
jgi:hypothetical protein